jgi:hypothetical protein
MADDNFDTLLKFDVVDLDRLQQRYAQQNNAAGVALVNRALAEKGPVQTEALSNSGQLYRYTRTDSETGRITHSWVGDWSAAFSAFQPTGPMIAKVNRELFTGANGPEAFLHARREREIREAGIAALAARDAKTAQSAQKKS